MAAAAALPFSMFHSSARFFASVCESATTTATAETVVPPIRSTEDLHTALLSFAHAAASPAADLRNSEVIPHAVEKTSSTEEDPPETCRTDVTHSSTEDDNTDRSSSKDAHGNFSLNTAANKEDELLQQLLLRRRSGRRRQREKDAAAASKAAQLCPSRRSPTSSSRSSSDLGNQAGMAVKLNRRDDASWAHAFELFSEAVQQHHVTPTAQHFNLLYYIAQQHRLWSRMDAVEEFQAHLLASVQQLVAEKRRERERRNRGERDTESTPIMEAAQRTTTGLTASQVPASLSDQIAELQEMESALMPNAQTYELLLSAALARGSWSRALEYCEMRTRSGVAVLTDSTVQQVLQVYALADTMAAVTGGSGGSSLSSPLMQPRPNPPQQRLRTDQQGPGLRAAAQPRSSTTTTASRVRSQPADSLPRQYWLVALNFFRGSLQRVTSMQTVWSMVALLNHAGQHKEVLQLLNEDCRELVQAHLFSFASHMLSDTRERTALLQTLRVMSNAALEVGDWRVAQQLLRDVVELRRQLFYTRCSSADKRWGALSLSLSPTETGDMSLSYAAGDWKMPDGVSLYSNNKKDRDVDDGTRVESELQLSQYVLENTLHTLRRVRHYPDMVKLYRTSPHLTSENSNCSGGGVVGKKEVEVGELALVWRAMWTPQALKFIAQAGLATGDLDLLLHLCGLTEEDRNAAVSPHEDTPVDSYDAALRLLQSRILKHHLRHQATSNEERVKTTVEAHERVQRDNNSEAQRYVALSQRVYAAYRQRALEAVDEETSPYRQYLLRLSEKLPSSEKNSTTSSTQQQQRPAQREKDLLQASSFLSATHAQLAQLLAQSLQPGITEESFRSLRQQVVAQFKCIRRPDTLSIALAVDTLRSLTRFTPAATSPGKQRFVPPLNDAEAQSLILAVQQIFDTVMEDEGLGSVQFIAANNNSNNNGTSFLPYTSPQPPPENVSLQQLKALSVITSATVLMSLDILARVQPLVLLRFLPRTVKLGWLPRALVAVQLQAAQRAVVEWTTARQHDIAPQLQPTHITKLISKKTLASSGAAVANFVCLYAQSTMAAVLPAQKVLAAAAQVLTELQRTTVGPPATAAVSTFKRTLQSVWNEQNFTRDAALEVAVVVSVNALVQQVSVSTVCRWTMWGDCADLLGSYFSSPLASLTRCKEEINKGTQSCGRVRAVVPNLETLRVLRTFLRLCDRAEAPFVEFVTMRWILNGEGETPPPPVTVDGMNEKNTSFSASGHNTQRVAVVVQKLCEVSSHTPSQSPSRTPSTDANAATPHPLSEVQIETMLLLLDALAWACRRHDRPLARQLFTALTPWMDILLTLQPPPPSDAEAFSNQRRRLRDAAQSSYMTLLQCFSNGSRSDVLRDWPVLQHVLRRSTSSVSQQLTATASFLRLRSTAVLLDGIAAVAVKLQRTLHFLLIRLSLDTHRALAQTHNDSRSAGAKLPRTASAVLPQHQHAVETAAEEFSTWCTAELLPHVVLPCLHLCEESVVDGVMPPLMNSLLTSLHKVTEAVWEVDFVSFVWRTKFRPDTVEQVKEGGVDPSAQALARLQQRGYQLLTSQMRWLTMETTLTRPLHLWLLFVAHASTIASAASAVSTNSARGVTELCRDLTTLETLYTIRPSTVETAAEHRTTAPLFPHFFMQQVDELTTAMLARAASTTSTTSASPTDLSTRSPGSSALPRLHDGSSAMELLTKPLLHFTPSVLRLLQQTAQQMLYLSLCEGTTDLQTVGSSAVNQPTDFSDKTPSSSSFVVPLSAALLRRCLAWPGQPNTYPALLRAVEAVAYETLRASTAVVDVFHNITQLRNAESTLAFKGEGEKRADRELCVSSAEMFLSFYSTSASLRKASPVSKDVCLAALLACASTIAATATTVTGDEDNFPLPPQGLLTLLRAFPHVLSDQLFKLWQQRALTVQQETVLRSWMLTFLWGGTQTSVAAAGAVAAPTAMLSSLQLYSWRVAGPFPLPLRRAALFWLVLTQGTILPSLVASSLPHTSQSPDAATPRALSASESGQLVALHNRASDFFVDLMNGRATSFEALQVANTRQLSILTTFSPHDNPPEGSVEENDKAAAVSAVQTAVSHCMTRHAVQDLLLQYPSVSTSHGFSSPPQLMNASSSLRTPIRPHVAELDALVHVLPASAQKDAKARFNSDIKSSYHSVTPTDVLPPSYVAAGDAPHLEQWAASLARWIDDFIATAQKKDKGAVPLLFSQRPPPLMASSNKSEVATWKDVFDLIRAAIPELSQQQTTTLPSSSLPYSGRDSNFCAETGRRRTAFRSAIEHLIREGADLNASGQTAAAGEVSACVNALLLFSCVFLPLSSSACPCGSKATALLRHELLAFLYVFCPSHSTPNASSLATLKRYKWFVQQQLRPLAALDIPRLSSVITQPTPTRPHSSSVTAALASLTMNEIILHQLSVVTCVLCTGSSSAAVASVFDCVYETARILFHQSSQDLCELFDTFLMTSGNATPLLRGAVRTWMQAGVLLGEHRTLLWVGQRLIARLVRRQQEKDAAVWTSKVNAETSNDASYLHEEEKALLDWLEVVPLAAAVCIAVRNVTAKGQKADEALTDLLCALPLLRGNDVFVSSKGVYASLIRLWQEKIQDLATQPAKNNSVCPPTQLFLQHLSYLTRFVHAQPFSVVFQFPQADIQQTKDADSTVQVAEHLRRQVAAYLAGPAAAYPPLNPSPSPRLSVDLPVQHTASNNILTSPTVVAAEVPLTVETLRTAMRCVETASIDDMKIFVQLESTKRTSTHDLQRPSKNPTKSSSVERIQRGRKVQAAWHLMERAAFHHRQRMSRRDSVTGTPPLTLFAEWTSVFLSPSVAAVPHTIHFIRPAVSEVLILESCRDWAETMAVLRHSLGTLQHTGATPVQQYMAQLLLQRLRTTLNISDSTEVGIVSISRVDDFCARLDSFSYTVAAAPPSCSVRNDGSSQDPQQLWKQHLAGHEAHGAAALVCCLIDLLFDRYGSHSADTSASHSTLISQHTLREALRCSVHDAVVSKALFRLFWALRYRHVKGAHVFLSAVRAAKLARDETFAVQAVLVYLWATTPVTAQRRSDLWRTQVLAVLSARKNAASSPGVDVLALAVEAQQSTNSAYPLSAEAHRAVWTSWTTLCRMSIVSEAAALGVVDAFKALHRLTEVEELMVTTCYTLKKK